MKIILGPGTTERDEYSEIEAFEDWKDEHAIAFVGTSARTQKREYVRSNELYRIVRDPAEASEAATATKKKRLPARVASS